MKTLIKFFLVLILNLILIYQSALSSDKIKIGLIVPLSGEYSNIGNSIIDTKNIIIAEKLLRKAKKKYQNL